MIFKMITYFLVIQSFMGCASNMKQLKEIDAPAPNRGSLYKLSSYVIEVSEVSNRRLKLYFYDANLRSISMDKVQIKDGVLDSDATKMNYGIEFVRHEHHMEALVHTKYDTTEDFDLEIDVKIDGHRRKISIPFNRN